MADLGAEWSTNSNDAVVISLVTPSATGVPKSIAIFHPTFTYPIFGDEESIFGYQGLKIHLRYHASSMRPNIDVTFNKKFKTVGETEATDIKATLEDWLPKAAFDKNSVFDSVIRSDNQFTPCGELYKSIKDGDKTLEIWKGNLGDKAVQQFLKRIQILVPFFIEGGTPINLEEPEWSLRRWTLFFLFEKRAELETSTAGSPYVFMGYCTIYRFFHYPLPSPPTTPSKKQIDSDAAEPKPPQSEPNGDGDGVPFEFPIPQVDASSLPCRSRISQFLILPPFQNSGLGSLLYSSIYEYYLSHPQTVEITVEDPNESFDDLRDLNDLKYLRENEPEFLALRINTSVQVSRKGKGFGGKAKASVVPVGQILDLPTIDSLRHRTKLAPRQFQRLVEMHLLSLIPSSIRRSLLHENPPSGLSEKETREWEHEYRLWGLVVKQRLYRHNRDMLMQLEARERVEKLEEAAGNVELDYGRLLGIAKHRARRDVEKGLERSGEGGDGEIGGLKRRAEGGVDGGSEAKKVRLTEGNGEV